MGQKAALIWLTGVSGAGKTTLADLTAQRLHAAGHAVYVLDGDEVRAGLSRDLGFTDDARLENNRRLAEVARLMVDAGLLVICAAISPFRSARELARSMVEPGEFVEVHLDVSMEVAAARDAKGLYARAKAGQVLHFTGFDSIYEPPLDPELRIDTERNGPEAAAELLITRLQQLGIV